MTPRTENGSQPESNPPLVVVSGALELPDDEGTRKFTHTLITYASSVGIQVIAVSGSDPIHVRKLFLSGRLMAAIRRSGAKTVIYVPHGSASVGSFLRAAMLRVGAGVRVVLIALWFNPRRTLGEIGARVLGPNLVLTPSMGLLNDLQRLGLRASFVPMGVDVERFHPVDGATKRHLRKLHGLPEDHQLILHVGHLQRLRNLEWLVEVRKAVNATVLLVGSTSPGADPQISKLLRGGNIRLIDNYLPHIEEMYQLADVYSFPVMDERGAIGVPLSVLEAMACNLPVVTTRFGSLPKMFEEGGGLLYATTLRAFVRAVQEVLNLPADAVRTRARVLQYSWEKVLGVILSAAHQVEVQ